ncbi:hypothetical protein HDF24_21615 [Mucilaginibacter sp. X4EP1]|jgi:hypothetical protein|uniref:hypothetical protein n=1 Tax=Mucilaginibacter sp. X4EP1 TaxID=2723092 RepID=UPI0021670889|nr:hypothetical protein [Mucilaginibacter sp. X4EP1]MCS3812418.1 hypothetical protein [Mucilaginibacter sp. X4EP1]
MREFKVFFFRWFSKSNKKTPKEVLPPKKVDKYIPKEILDSFTSLYQNEDIWQIHSGNYWLTIFLYKENQIEFNKDLPKYNEIKKGYLELVNKYLDPEIKEIYLTFDSKESFEIKYGGNWYDYYH